MEAITYTERFGLANANSQKVAKINQVKLKTLKDKGLEALKQNSVIKEEVKTTPIVNTVASVNPTTLEQPKVEVAATPIVVRDNYNEVADKFMMTVYKDTFKTKPLTGARKIRVNGKVTKHVRGMDRKLGVETILDDIPVVKKEVNSDMQTSVTSSSNNTLFNDFSNDNIVEHEKPKTTPVSNVVEFPKTNTVVMENSLSPSVDDYLQKERPNQENGLIIQLTSDVDSLKEETLKRTAILEKLEAQYKEIKERKAKRIKELEEERLSYTATLDGLTEKIRSIQEAIAKEEQSMSGYQKTA